MPTVYELAAGDPVSGGTPVLDQVGNTEPTPGAAGISNAQALQLANRTQYLRRWGKAETVYLTGDTTLTTADFGKHFMCYESLGAPMTVTLPDVSGGGDEGRMISITCGFGNAPIKIDGGTINFGQNSAATFNEIYLHAGEIAVLLEDANGAGGWLLVEGSTQQLMSGKIYAEAANVGFTPPPIGGLLADGSTVSEDDYPRLFQRIGITYGNTGGAGTFDLPNVGVSLDPSGVNLAYYIIF